MTKTIDDRCGHSDGNYETVVSSKDRVEVRCYDGPDWGMSDGLGINNTRHFRVYVNERWTGSQISDLNGANHTADEYRRKK